MSNRSFPSLSITGFADEAPASRTIEDQALVASALGMRWITLRFAAAGRGVRNVCRMSGAEIRRIRRVLDDAGLSVSSIGSPVGKVALRRGGGGGRYVSPGLYLRTEVEAAVRRAHAFECRLIRGFSFYPPRDVSPDACLEEAVERIGAIVERFESEGVVLGLEVEANLVGRTGRLIAEICGRIDSNHLCAVFDGGNLAALGMREKQVFEEYRAMRPWLGWIHVKDYRPPPGMRFRRNRWIEEGSLRGFVVPGEGEGAYARVFEDLRRNRGTILRRLGKAGISRIFVDLEPHLRSGGQFGGSSGPDGFGAAMRALVRMLERTGWRTDLREGI